jgi:hypothetical protein
VISEEGSLTPWLRKTSPALFTAFAMFAGFSTYFCMYAFRKPFAAARFDGLKFLGTSVDLKTAFVISQIVGYTVSKYIGIKVCSEAQRGQRAVMLVFLILAAEAALTAFAVLPDNLKVVAIFFNGLPLGMVWGLVVWYLEGRRTSELLLAGLSCSFIVSSGIVKDVGLWLMSGFGVPETWMPCVTGLAFLPAFLGSVWLLNQLPPPDAADVAARTSRVPMNYRQRLRFVQRLLLGLVLLIVVYLFLTAYRDFRDNFGVEILNELGLQDRKAIFTRTESCVAVGVLAALAALNLVKDNRRGLLGAFFIMISGLMIVGAGTLLLDLRAIDAFFWVVFMGLGSYLAYVPFGSVLFDRLIATTRFTGTAVFAIYLADAAGYSGSVGVQLYKDLARTEMSRFEFFRVFSYVLSAGGSALMIGSCWYFLRKSHSKEHIASSFEVTGPATEPGKVL